ncbi:unnamed protein product, partial [Staurois parvus]
MGGPLTGTMTHSGILGSSDEEGGTKGPMTRLRASASSYEEVGEPPYTYHKMEPTNSVRRPERGT